MVEPMTPDDDLERALDPVRHLHNATHVTPNTVLAAHLRAQGVHPVGPIWAAAKQHLVDGLSFAQAAGAAAAEFSSEEPIDVQTEESAPSSAQQDLASPSRPDTETDRSSPDGTTQELHRVRSWSPSGPPDAAPQVATLTRRSGLPHPLGNAGAMSWFPKRYGPGDLDGKGASRLLGTPNVPLSTVLVRETAQNSWDARLGHKPVTFALHLRRLDDTERAVLRNRVFTGSGSGLRLQGALGRPGLRVLEVADRGTKGLGGPTRNDIEPPLGSTTNYIDLVLNIGAPRDVHLGGGTYGFGKTIAYRASRAGAVLLWSRSLEDGQVEDRLIGSAIGDSFTLEGKRFTGRHWWGALKDEGARVDPWIGMDAARIAHRVFDSSYTEDSTGTTLMIIDPDLGGEDEEDDVNRLSDAILWNLWPKLLPTQRGSKPMNIELYVDGALVPLPEIAAHPVLAGFADALQMVRATQDGRTYAPQFNTTVHEVRSHRPRALIGHLAVTRYPIDTAKQERETVPVSPPTSHVAWMRHDAELVVRYDERARLDSEMLQWAAVFKPLADHDDAFAEAEPPAHDDWVPASIEDPRNRSLVRVGIRRTHEIITEQMAPPPVPSSQQTPRSVAALADSLAKLVGATPGSKPERGKSSTGGGSSKRKRPQARVARWVRGDVQDGYRVLSVLVEMTTATMPASVHADVGVATDGSRMHDDELVQLLGWATSQELSSAVDPDPPVLRSGDQRWLFIRAASGAGVDLSLSCKEVD